MCFEKGNSPKLVNEEVGELVERSGQICSRGKHDQKIKMEIRCIYGWGKYADE